MGLPADPTLLDANGAEFTWPTNQKPPLSPKMAAKPKNDIHRDVARTYVQQE